MKGRRQRKSRGEDPIVCHCFSFPQFQFNRFDVDIDDYLPCLLSIAVRAPPIIARDECLAWRRAPRDHCWDARRGDGPARRFESRAFPSAAPVRLVDDYATSAAAHVFRIIFFA